jgi:hypothetical protein
MFEELLLGWAEGFMEPERLLWRHILQFWSKKCLLYIFLNFVIKKTVVVQIRMDQKQIHQQPESWSGYSKIPGSGSRHIDSDPKCWVTANKNYWYRYCTVCKIAFQLVKTDTCKQPRNTCFYGMVLTTRMTCNSMTTPVRLWSATCIFAKEAVSHHSTAYNTVYHINNKCVLKSQHAIDIPVMRNW